MREMETLEQFAHWLTEQGKRPATVAKYCACLSARREENPRCLHAWAADRGLCPPETALDGLDMPELYRIAWQGRDALAPLSRSALAALMEFRLSLEPPLPPMERTAGPQLDDVRRALQSAYIEEGNEPEGWRTAGAYRALAQLMLQAPGYEIGRKDQWERELCPGGKHYPLNRQVMLWNLEHQAEAVETEIGTRLTGLLALAEETERGQCRGLCRFLSAAARRLKQIWQDRPGFSGSGSEQLLLRMAGWDTAGTGAGPDSSWYGALPPGEMRAHMTDLSRQLLRMCVEHGGIGFPPVRPVRPETEETIRLCRLLAPFDRLLEPEDWEQVRRDCGDRALERGQIAACLVQGLLRVEALPRRGGGVLALAGPLEETFRPEEERALLSAMAELWTDAQLRPILLALIRRLAERCAVLEREAEDWPEQSAALLSNEPELAALLAAAPEEGPAEGGSRRERLLDRLALETAGVEDPQLLLERFQALIARRTPEEEDLEGARQLTWILVRCHWARSRGRPTPAGAESLRRLLALYRRRPAAVFQALGPDLEEPEPELLPVMLLGRTAGLALALAEEKVRPCGERMFYANWARNAAGEGSGTARRLGRGPLAFDLGLLRCRAAALQAELEAERAAAAELLADHIVPCAAELLRCREILSDGGPGAETRWAETAQLCAAAFFSGGAPVRRRLEESALWPDLPHRMDTEEALRALTDREPAPGPVESGPRLLIPSPIPEPGPRHWYCAYLDSETSVRKGYSQERMESYMLKTLWSAQDIVLTANQAADNRVIRALAYEPGFQMLLRTGHVAVSLYHTFRTLRGYAAHQMRQTGPEPERRYFLWSSLPLEFNADPAARRAAADYLEGRGRADILPLRYRELIVRFGEALALLDENLAFRWKTDRFQRPGRSLPGLWERLDAYYLLRRERPEFRDLYRVHVLLVRSAPDGGSRGQLTRSAYQAALDGLRTGELDALHQLEPFCHPEILRPGSRERRFLEGLAGGSVPDRMQVVLSDAQNRMLGALCGEYQHHIYSQEERVLIPYDESDPIRAVGHRIFEDTLTVTETGLRLGWSQTPELLEAAEALRRERPGLRPEDLAAGLSGAAGPSLAYTVSEDGREVQVARGVIRTSSDRALVLEMKQGLGTIHMETEGV